MGDLIHIEEGSRPWMPAHDVVPFEVLDHYNVPRAGLLHQSGQTFFFDCIIGDGEPTGIWAYVHVNEYETRQLLAISGPEDFDAVVDSIMVNRWVTLAVATDHKIKDSAHIDAGTETGLDARLALAQKMMNRWAEKEQAHRQASRLVEATSA